ncbi:uncharacterized protein LOC116342763 [Contarinia nasturtii]|uniref:uncharacterized protein LOC116342763 n=1 Tax=Contarinia nasturtii TaxID=265458 RepID=UPI0012D3F5E8|nr:uncharacterized protein LOC116342763 [Contarinia nasturtii]
MANRKVFVLFFIGIIAFELLITMVQCNGDPKDGLRNRKLKEKKIHESIKRGGGRSSGTGGFRGIGTGVNANNAGRVYGGNSNDNDDDDDGWLCCTNNKNKGATATPKHVGRPVFPDGGPPYYYDGSYHNLPQSAQPPQMNADSLLFQAPAPGPVGGFPGLR